VTRFRELEDASNKFSQKYVLWQSKKEWEELSEKWLRDDFMSLNS